MPPAYAGLSVGILGISWARSSILPDGATVSGSSPSRLNSLILTNCHAVDRLNGLIKFAQIDRLPKIDLVKCQQAARRLLHLLLDIFAGIIVLHPHIGSDVDLHIIHILDFDR